MDTAKMAPATMDFAPIDSATIYSATLEPQTMDSATIGSGNDESHNNEPRNIGLCIIRPQNNYLRNHGFRSNKLRINEHCNN